MKISICIFNGFFFLKKKGKVNFCSSVNVKFSRPFYAHGISKISFLCLESFFQNYARKLAKKISMNDGSSEKNL